MSQNTMTMKMMIDQAENDLLHTYNRYQVVLDEKFVLPLLHRGCRTEDPHTFCLQYAKVHNCHGRYMGRAKHLPHEHQALEAKYIAKIL